MKQDKKKLIYEWVKSDAYKPMRRREMAAVLQVPRGDREQLEQILDELVQEGKLFLDAKGRYLAEKKERRTGIFNGTGRGFGFVTVEGEDEDVFIPEAETLGALNQDVVEILVSQAQTGRRREGKVVSILEHACKQVVGTFFKRKNFGFVVSDDKRLGSDIFIPKEATKGAVTGHRVVVALTDYGTAEKNPEGEITEIIGHINDPSSDTTAILKAFGLETEFPAEVLKQAESVPEEVTEGIGGRLDCTGIQMVTIDGEDAKDLDDAVSLYADETGYHLGVHIADVSHYVTENSPLDEEAKRRGTSVYLIDRVVPMLPHRLSNGICSLNAGCRRFALSCFMDIDENGTVVGHRIAETLIQVDRRMSYTEVNHILTVMNPKTEQDGQADAAKKEEQEKILAEYGSLVPMLVQMAGLAGILREKRRKRGSIDFDFPESKIVLDENGRPLEIKPYERNQATKLIEDFMLIANETVAEDFFWQEVPFVYRVHESPDEEKMKKLGIFIQNFGYSLRLGRGEVHPKELQKLLAQVEGSAEEALIARLTLRSMKQAKYQTECEGHFGLSTRYYCHFTSPIRRYPDLQIHRIIKENLRGGLTERRREHYAGLLDAVALHSSKTERAADEAERELEKAKKAEYMEERIGQTFTGVISGVTNWGMYVELPNTVEGMIRMSDLTDDYYRYDEEQYRLVGEHTNRVYKLGQTIEVIVANVDKILKSIDFLPARR